MIQEDLKQVFVTYIKSTKEKLWDALINPEMTSQYYYGSRIKSDFNKRSLIEFIMKDKDGQDRVPVHGLIEELIPYERLVYTFEFDDQSDAPSRVAFEIDETDMGLKLTVLHDQFESKTATYHSVSTGWPYIISGLKSVLETGRSI